MALSREDIAAAAYNGQAEPVDTIFSDRSYWHPEREFPTTADMDEARRLIDETGVDISDVTITLKYLEATQELEVQLAAAAWTELGFAGVDIQVMESARVVDEIGAGEWDVILFLPTSVTVPTRQYTYYDPAADWRFGLSGFLDNAETQALVAEAMVERDNEVRKDLYAQIDQIGSYDESSLFFTIRPKLYVGMSERVNGWDQSENSTIWSWWMRGGLLTASVSE
jgi:ABC-type transport system substrate-binding protein